MSRVLFITDSHCPFMREGFVDFAKGVYKLWKCDTVVFGGDLLDLHRISRHTSHPDSLGAKDEYEKAMKQVNLIYKAFPNVKAIYGNHDDRYYVEAGEKANIPSNMLKTIEQLTKSPRGWKWADKWTIDDVLYIHGTAYSGTGAHLTAARNNLKSVVMGHLHTQAVVQYIASPDELIFAAVGGCAMDSNSYAAAYAQFRDKKPVVGCLVVLNGKTAYFEAMDLGKRVKRL
jgi:predicted phosphodiesterase